MDGVEIVKLVAATIAETVAINGVVGTTHVGAEGKFPANDIGVSVMRLAAVTAVVFTV